MESEFRCVYISGANSEVETAEESKFLLFDMVKLGLTQQSQVAQILTMALYLWYSKKKPLLLWHGLKCVEIGGFAGPTSTPGVKSRLIGPMETLYSLSLPELIDVSWDKLHAYLTQGVVL